jgi:hypothetical protein
MDEIARSNPTSPVTAREFADAVRPARLQGLTEANMTAAIADVERRALDLARRLGVDRADGKYPAYIWAIVLGQEPD